jgi:hypothetical protein
LANIACEIGADIFEGNVTFPSDNGLWNVRRVDFSQEILRWLRRGGASSSSSPIWARPTRRKKA